MFLAPITTAQWQTNVHSYTAAQALHAAHASFVAQTQNGNKSLSTLARLRAHQRDHGSRAALLYSAVDMPGHAEAALAGTPPADTTAAHLAIARAYYRSGNYATVQRVLLDTDVALPAALRRQRASLLARSLIQQKRYDEAALPLAATEQLGPLPAIDRYNLGIAWLGAGANARGAGELDKLGRYRGDNPQHRALAEQANLTLAYWLLDHGHAQQARQLLWRLPLTSPLVRKGMLALGWSEFLPTESDLPLLTYDAAECEPEPAELWQDAGPLHKVPRNHCRIPRIKRRQGRLASLPNYADADSRYMRAAAAWQAAITGGDTANPVVAEALVCLPYALFRAGDLARAQTAYTQAVNQLQTARQQQEKIQAGAGSVPTATPAFNLTQTRRLLRIKADLEALQTHLRQRITRLIAIPQNRHAHEVASAIADMRNNAKAGRSLAPPTPKQRGQLLLALAALLKTDLYNTRNKQRLAQLQQRVAGLNAQITQALDALNTHLHAHRQQARQKRNKQLRIYLRDARKAFADLGQSQPAANPAAATEGRPDG